VSLDPRAILSRAPAYSLFRRLVGRDSARSMYVREHLRLEPGARVLDLGCGTADILEHLPAVDYVGYDISPRYIERARRRFGSRGRFHCRAVDEALPVAAGGADLVIAHGVLHHLDDTAARDLLRVARKALRQGGRLVSFDGCFAEGQSFAARFFVSLDRGRHVRHLAAYEALARAEFAEVRCVVRHGLLRIPYTHLIMECTA
jgi:SAM-dependent methyltransferase